MDNSKLRAMLPTGTFGIVETCAAGVVATIGLTTATPASATLQRDAGPATAPIAASMQEAPTQAGHAIMLRMMHTDPATGEQVAQHYSHASHASHASHYSSRY
jgi:hypothetical protein